MAPMVGCVLAGCQGEQHNKIKSSDTRGGAFIPVEHNPLGTGGDTVMTLVQGRETGQDCIIIVGHDDRIRVWAGRMVSIVD